MIAGIVSPYSFDGSVIRFEEVVRFAKSAGITSLLLCDTNFHGAVLFNKLCRSNGITPVHGIRISDRVFYAKNKDEFEELIKAYNENREPRTESIPVEELKLSYFLHPEDYDAHVTMCKILTVEPRQDTYFDGQSTDPAKVLKTTSYDLNVRVTLPQPKKGWLRSFTEKVPEELKRKFIEEVEVVEKLGYESYFYVVKQIVETAKQLGISLGPGRGSAVGSVISYVLGITIVNPVEHGLMFERFLNEYRNEPPDIDIDVEDERRQELINKLAEKFPFVAQVSSFSRLSERSLLNELKRQNLSASNKTLKRLAGLPVRRSIHASGVVITDSSVNIPMVPNVPQRITEYDIYSLEDVGIIKIDILGLATLSFLSKLKKASKTYHISYKDQNTYSMIKKGQTLGVFQLESETARKLCRQVRVENFDELAILLALNRPGPLGAKLNEIYAKRKRHCEKADKLSPETRGVIVYQEQIMKLAMNLAGLSPAEADLFRKAVSSKNSEVMKEALTKLKIGMQQRGYSSGEINQLISTIQNFAEYAFNKSHSVAYSYLSYELAYLKNLSPKLFFTEYIKRHSAEREKIFLAVQELRNLGYRVLPPSVNQCQISEQDFQLPFEAIEGISSSFAKKISDNAPYHNIEDFVKRTKASTSVVQKLVFAGAFDCIYNDREKSILAFESFRMGFDPALLEISSKFGKRYQSSPVELTDRKLLEYEEQSYGFPLTPLSVQLNKSAAPVTEVFASFRVLPVVVSVVDDYASDGKTVFKLKSTISDGQYLLLLKPDGGVTTYEKLENVFGFVYELTGCFDEKDFEDASDLECTELMLTGRKILLRSVRPTVDDYRFRILSSE